MIYLHLDNYQSRQKTFSDPMKISSQNFSSTFATNKCRYAYDNLAYGFSNDVKHASAS